LQRKMQISCMSEHNMRTMEIEYMQLVEQKHAK